MTLGEEIIRHKLRPLLQILPEVSLYVVTFATIYYNEWSSAALPVYKMLADIFGYSVQGLAFGWVCVCLLNFNLRAKVAMFGLSLYFLISFAFDILSLIDPTIQFTDIYPTFETFSMLVFTSFTSSLYIDAWKVKVSEVIEKWQKL